MPQLEREEYIEQAYLFRGLNNRHDSSDPVQVVMKHLRDEILSTTKLPMAVDYLLAELTHVGTMGTAMKKLAHYFAPFQTFLVSAAEDEIGRFDMRRALLILEYEASYRAESTDPISMFFFQFETICQNRLDYDYGLKAIAGDALYDETWKKWILSIRHKIGMVGLADLVYVASQHYVKRQMSKVEYEGQDMDMPDVVLFGEKEGRIALANRGKDPMYLFLALQRQLDYPAVPKPKKKDPIDEVLPKLVKAMERMQMRMKLMEDEQRDKGIDLSQFYGKSGSPDSD
ncbi:MAG: hypothetical protein ACI87E_001126 [Mariniblastus sp.]|jgi:hypothetical protein